MVAGSATINRPDGSTIAANATFFRVQLDARIERMPDPNAAAQRVRTVGDDFTGAMEDRALHQRGGAPGFR
jgi:hypothetical protein